MADTLELAGVYRKRGKDNGLVEECQQHHNHWSGGYQQHSAFGGWGDRGACEEILSSTGQSWSAARVRFSRASFSVSRGYFSIATRIASGQTLSKICAATRRSSAV